MRLCAARRAQTALVLPQAGLRGKAWGNGSNRLSKAGSPPLQKFAQRLQGYWHGIVARCRHPLNTSVVEGINNTIKVIKRRAYGYRDEQYFFLKIRAAFPGIPR
ncbi:transposase family protein [Burkholderia mallei]|nr:transposase family protein [Burkholderia mallei]